jgi:hypothetical protein
MEDHSGFVCHGQGAVVTMAVDRSQLVSEMTREVVEGDEGSLKE